MLEHANSIPDRGRMTEMVDVGRQAGTGGFAGRIKGAEIHLETALPKGEHKSNKANERKTRDDHDHDVQWSVIIHIGSLKPSPLEPDGSGFSFYFPSATSRAIRV